MSQEELSPEVPINDNMDKTESKGSCQYDFEDRDRFKVDFFTESCQ